MEKNSNNVLFFMRDGEGGKERVAGGVLVLEEDGWRSEERGEEGRGVDVSNLSPLCLFSPLMLQCHKENNNNNTAVSKVLYFFIISIIIFFFIMKALRNHHTAFYGCGGETKYQERS